MNAADCAAILAKRLHQGQVDKAGVDYFEGHLSEVASQCYELECKCCAYLHDAAEDTPYSEEEVLKMLEEEIEKNGAEPLTERQRQNILDTLKLMNHHNYSTREAYIEGFRGNARAIMVKMADLQHNMDIARIPNPTEKDFARLKRYEKEYALLKQWYNDSNTYLCKKVLMKKHNKKFVENIVTNKILPYMSFEEFKKYCLSFRRSNPRVM